MKVPSEHTEDSGGTSVPGALSRIFLSVSSVCSVGIPFR